MKIKKEWLQIGTVVGNASTSEYSFILKSFKSRVGDLIAVCMKVPNDDRISTSDIYVWGRIVSINRYNPFFPYEAAQELSEEGISLEDTILSNSKDQLEATVLILGFSPKDSDFKTLLPLTYPVQPAAQVLYPPAGVVKDLLAGGIPGHQPLHIGTLIARKDVDISISADRIVARHMAILAMTGGGKTVAARRILRELIDAGYPILILDPHGDYLGLWQKRDVFKNTKVNLVYPSISMTKENRHIIEVLINKMTEGLTEPQKEEMSSILAQTDPEDGEPVLAYLKKLIAEIGRRLHQGQDKRKIPTLNVCKRQLAMVESKFERMEKTNERMRKRLNKLDFTRMPDPQGSPEGIIAPNTVTILYLGGYDHLTQTTIASILLEALYEHRANLSNRIPPFLALIEEAHTFIPSSREAGAGVPSLETVRKLITEGRKFGTGLLLVTQRPSRVDETILSQCNSFLILRLVNPRDQSFVKQIMENLSEQDAKMLPGFGPGQGIVSGQAVRFPLLVKIKMDEDLIFSDLGDENFFKQVKEWKPDKNHKTREEASRKISKLTSLTRGGTSNDIKSKKTEKPPPTIQERWEAISAKFTNDERTVGELATIVGRHDCPKKNSSIIIKDLASLKWGKLMKTIKPIKTIEVLIAILEEVSK